FLSAYSAVSQGHCHPRIIEALKSQAGTLSLTSCAFYNDKLGPAERFLCEYFDYEKALFMNSSVEAGETALKLTRKWAYKLKGTPINQALRLFAEGNFLGRTVAAVSASTDPQSQAHNGPYLPGLQIVPYNDSEEFERALQQKP